MKQYAAKSLRPALRHLLILSVVLTLIVGMSAAAYAMVDISEKYYITDEAGVISDATEEYIVSQNALLEQNCSGAQIVVVVVDFLDGMDIEDYCYQLFDELDIGSDAEDNGVLLLLTIGEENYWCMQGTGLINSLSSGTIDDILWYNLEPDFAVGNYDAGVKTVFDALYKELCSIYGVSGADSYYDGSDYLHEVGRTARMVSMIITIIAILIIMIVILYIYTMIKKSASRRRYYEAPPRPTYHPTHGPHPGHVRPTTRPRRTRPVIIINNNPRPARPSRPTSRPSSFGGGSTFGGGGRSSFGGGRSSGMGRGGGGMSRGGGAGRRGR